MEKKDFLLALSTMPSTDIEDIISSGKAELDLREKKDWYEAINEVMTAIHNLKMQFPQATCYVEWEVEPGGQIGDFELLGMFETVTEDTFKK